MRNTKKKILLIQKTIKFTRKVRSNKQNKFKAT